MSRRAWRDHRLPAALLLALVLTLSHGAAGPAAAAEGDDWEEEPWGESSAGPFELHGFVEAAAGRRTADDDAVGDDTTLGELRFRGEISRAFGRADASLKADLFSDSAIDDDLGYKLREAVVSFSAGDVDFRLGRQILTWGTGDLVFLNDLFPKDWVSFFAGRETSYLKYPSDSLKISLYKRAINLDVVWTPIFRSDNFVTGERFSYFSPAEDARVAAPPELNPVQPARTLEHGELAVRLHRSVRSYELALYGYRGFFKQPTGFDAALDRAVFAPLSAFGASLRGPAWGGISHAEVVWYDSRDDRRGDDPLTPNSQYRILLGHERELVANLTFGAQYYLEGIADHDRLLDALPAAQARTAPDRLRHVVTTRLGYRAVQERLSLSLFVFASPHDRDFLLIPGVGYRVNDRWQLDAGLHLFGGEDAFTFLGQFADNSSVYLRARFSF